MKRQLRTLALNAQDELLRAVRRSALHPNHQDCGLGFDLPVRLDPTDLGVSHVGSHRDLLDGLPRRPGAQLPLCQLRALPSPDGRRTRLSWTSATRSRSRIRAAARGWRSRCADTRSRSRIRTHVFPATQPLLNPPNVGIASSEAVLGGGVFPAWVMPCPADFVALAAKVDSALAAIHTWATTFTVPTAMGPSGTATPGSRVPAERRRDEAVEPNNAARPFRTEEQHRVARDLAWRVLRRVREVLGECHEGRRHRHRPAVDDRDRSRRSAGWHARRRRLRVAGSRRHGGSLRRVRRNRDGASVRWRRLRLPRSALPRSSHRHLLRLMPPPATALSGLINTWMKTGTATPPGGSPVNWT